MSVSPSSRKRKVGESNPPTPFPGQLVSNQSPKPVRLPSVLSGLTGNRTRPVLLKKGPPRQGGVSHPPKCSTHRATHLSAALSSGFTSSVHSGAPGNRTPITWVQAKCLPVRPASRCLQEVRPGIEPDLPPYQGGVLPKHLQTRVIPAGIEPALSCMSRRRLRRWTTGS